ncbi:MAG: response regulator [Proteobacteria bacterium]|nr:response regulator [Pseudomonadota bacterium]MBU1596403.1 response regulator [Pseudomonadota bacterium]
MQHGTHSQMRPRILLAEDESVIALQLEELIAAAGYEVVGLAGTAAEAVRLATSLRPDLVLMDIVMPVEPDQEMDGIDACAVIQRELHIPVVLLTAHGEEQFLRRARTALPSAYLLKPCQNAQIRAAVEVALAMRAHNDPAAGFRLREAHHRIKNSFSLLHGMLRTQQSQVEGLDARRSLADAGARVMALASAHEAMSDPAREAGQGAGPFIEKLARSLFEANAQQGAEGWLRLDVAAEAVSMDAARLVPCGIFLAEAMTNALKYAFSDGQAGCIRVALRPVGEDALLEVSDDGVGLPARPEELGRNSFGLQCLHAAASQLGGVLDIKSEPGQGSNFSVRFPMV